MTDRTTRLLAWGTNIASGLILATLVFVFWRNGHESNPEALRGTWAWDEAPKSYGWTESDTIWLGPGSLAYRRGRAVWRGRTQQDSDTLTLIGPYSWGVRHPLSKPARLCLHYRDESPPFGCLDLKVGKDDLMVGKALFRRIRDLNSAELKP